VQLLRTSRWDAAPSHYKLLVYATKILVVRLKKQWSLAAEHADAALGELDELSQSDVGSFPKT